MCLVKFTFVCKGSDTEVVYSAGALVPACQPTWFHISEGLIMKLQLAPLVFLCM
jgi:hypothetical protein